MHIIFYVNKVAKSFFASFALGNYPLWQITSSCSSLFYFLAYKVLLPIPRNIPSSGHLMTQYKGNSSIFTSGDLSVSLVSWKHFILLTCPSWHSRRSVPLESHPSPFSTLLCSRKVDTHGLHHLVSSILWPLFVWPMERPARGKKVGWETSLTSWITSAQATDGRGRFPLSCITGL